MSIRSVAGFNVQCDLTRQQLLETLQYDSDDAYHKIPDLISGYESYGISALIVSLVLCVSGIGAGPGVFIFIIIGTSIAFGLTVHLRNLTIDVNEDLLNR